MAKMDISVTRTLTLGLGNYESAKPSITLTVKDVEAADVADAYLALDNVITGLFKLEVLAVVEEHSKIKTSGLNAYCSTGEQNRADIGAKIENSLVDLGKF
jgi:hypothetical protein